MTASANIKTPMMRLPLAEGTEKAKGEAFAKTLSKLVLSQIMENVVVQEELGPKSTSRSKLMTVTLQLWPKEAYMTEHNVTQEEVLQVIEKKFIPALERAINKDMKNRTRKSAETVDEEIGVGISMNAANKKKGAANEDDGNDSDGDAPASEVGDDGDATDAKTSRNKTQHASYDAPDEDDEEVIATVDSAMNVEEDDMEVDQAPMTDADRTNHEKVTQACQYIYKYDFDQSTGSSCRIKLRVSFYKIGRRLILLVPH